MINQAFSFQCLRPGGINAVLKERQSHQQDEQRTERVEIDEIAEIQCTATTSQVIKNKLTNKGPKEGKALNSLKKNNPKKNAL